MSKSFTRTVESTADNERLFILVDNKTLMVNVKDSKFKKGERVKIHLDSFSNRYLVSSLDKKGYTESNWYDVRPKKDNQ